jgi:Flp pilus assembly protein TadD
MRKGNKMIRKPAFLVLVIAISLGCSNPRREAERLVENGEYDKAIPRIRLELRKSGDDAALRALLTRAYLGSGQSEEAAREYKKAVGLDPKNEDLRAPVLKTLMDEGKAFFDKEDYYQAVGRLRAAVELDPNDAEAAATLGAALARTGRGAEGEEYLRRASEGPPKDPKLEATLGDLYYRQKRFVEARHHYSRALETGLENASVYARMAEIDMGNRDYPAAQVEIQKALDLDSQSFEARKALGNLHHLTSNLPQAEEQYRKALEIRPDDAETRAQLGLVLEKMNEFDAAETELIKASDVAPGNVLPLEYLLNLYFEKRNLDRYEQVCLRILRIDPGHKNAQFGLKWLAQERKQQESKEN